MSRDFDKVAPHLYQGGFALNREPYPEFSMIVLCSAEHQPELPRFAGKVLRPRFNDGSFLTKAERTRVAHTVDLVAKELVDGGRVLVTCSAGLNRSGLVTGLALCASTDLTTKQIVDRIRSARGPFALGNLYFEKLIRDNCRN